MFVLKATTDSRKKFIISWHNTVYNKDSLRKEQVLERPENKYIKKS